MMKPYRLINSQEMEELNQHFTQVIHDWNDEYALTPFDVYLAAPTKEYEVSQVLNIIANNQTVAIIEHHYLDLLNQILFGDNKPCFNSVSQELMLILLRKLFKLEQCSINEATAPIPNWFYKGSTCLLLTLKITPQLSPLQDIEPLTTKEELTLNKLTIILNPEWVYQSLAPNKTIKNNLDSLDEAIADRELTLNLELRPLSLPINQLINIQIGDVIATDHPITTALRLTQNEQLIAEAQLGQSSLHKSIVLKRSS